ncbi:MAG: TraR/DksA family transcriptional regulator [Bacteroidetes bacterium]|nr:TraR/DksA family transcriptional regulator [Bacteroidota bacterium]
MAVKKKAAKPAKKAPAKPAPKPAKAAVAKKAVAKKPAPKPVVAKKAAPRPAEKKAAPKPAAAAKPIPQKPVSKIVPKKTEPVKPAAPAPVSSIKQQGPYIPPKPTFKPVTNTPPPVPKKTTTPAKPTKVVLPEIKTKTVRKYHPDFTKSVLDQPIEQPSGPTMRYSDAELGEFKEIIVKKLDAAKKELAYLQGLITRRDEMGGDNDDARYMTMEDGSMSMEREQLSQMASRQITFIDHLEKALMRIENKTYGICRVTGKLIDKARLRAVPHATLSIEAKQMMNK